MKIITRMSVDDISDWIERRIKTLESEKQTIETQRVIAEFRVLQAKIFEDVVI